MFDCCSSFQTLIDTPDPISFALCLVVDSQDDETRIQNRKLKIKKALSRSFELKTFILDFTVLGCSSQCPDTPVGIQGQNASFAGCCSLLSFLGHKTDRSSVSSECIAVLCELNRP